MANVFTDYGILIIGSVVDVFVTEDKIFSGLFFQDKLMKYAFQCYPEVLMIDATYKLNELRMPMYLMLVINSNGSSEIVSIFLTVLETKEAISKMVESFKLFNPSLVLSFLTRILMSMQFLKKSFLVFQCTFVCFMY